jgi:hypothetical protein
MPTLRLPTRIRQVRSATFAAAVTLAVPGAISAQTPLETVKITAARSAEANALSEKAASLYSTSRKFKDAARLHMRAADLRAPGDAKGFDDLSMAAHLYWAAGDVSRAQESMERAAEHAAARGDIVAAARSYVDAGLLAIEDRHTDRVPELARKAELLASSPLLTEGQRAEIMRRVGSPKVAVGSP